MLSFVTGTTAIKTKTYRTTLPRGEFQLEPDALMYFGYNYANYAPSTRVSQSVPEIHKKIRRLSSNPGDCTLCESP